MTLNVAGLISIVKRKKIGRLIRQNKVDVVCLQETHVKEGGVQVLGSGSSRAYLPRLYFL